MQEKLMTQKELAKRWSVAEATLPWNDGGPSVPLL